MRPSGGELERPPGIEPGSSAWKADARPIGQGRVKWSPHRTYACWGAGGMPFADQLRSLWRDIPARQSRSARPGWFGRKRKSPQGMDLAGFGVHCRFQCRKNFLLLNWRVLESQLVINKHSRVMRDLIRYNRNDPFGRIIIYRQSQSLTRKKRRMKRLTSCYDKHSFFRQLLYRNSGAQLTFANLFFRREL